MNERLEMLVDFCIRDLDRMRASIIRKSCAAGQREKGRHAVCKVRRAVSIKIAVKDRKKTNIPADFQGR